MGAYKDLLIDLGERRLIPMTDETMRARIEAATGERLPISLFDADEDNEDDPATVIHCLSLESAAALVGDERVAGEDREYIQWLLDCAGYCPIAVTLHNEGRRATRKAATLAGRIARARKAGLADPDEWDRMETLEGMGCAFTDAVCELVRQRLGLLGVDG